ncbi:MAG: IS256 family transposase [Candidatus Oleimicrobiaceae bacterium]
MEIIAFSGDVFQVGRVSRQAVFELALREIRRRISEQVKVVIEAGLEAEVTAKLGRGRYQRRGTVARGAIDWHCPNCGSNRREDMSRDGHYERDLGTGWAQVKNLLVPRLECQRCKDSEKGSSKSADGKVRKGRGKVKTNFAVLRRAKRFWSDVDKNSLFKAGFCQSLRQMAEELGTALESSVGLQTLNKRVNAAVEVAKQWKEQPIKDVPDILQVDGLPFGVMEKTGEIKLDKKKRRRAKKKGSKRILLVALGIWSEAGQKQILDFEIVRQEGYQEWKTLLNRLYGRGLRREAGLEVIVHDGSKGLEAVIEEVYWQLKDQRCIFHKLTNVSDNITEKEDGQRKKQVKADAKAIYEAETKEEARKRAEGFAQKWGAEEPKAVASLMSDFEKTLTYYDLPEKRRELVRTISLQERMNRELRRKVRQVGVFWSDEGPEATFYLIAERLNRQWRKQTWVEATTPLAFRMVA